MQTTLHLVCWFVRFYFQLIDELVFSDRYNALLLCLNHFHNRFCMSICLIMKQVMIPLLIMFENFKLLEFYWYILLCYYNVRKKISSPSDYLIWLFSIQITNCISEWRSGVFQINFWLFYYKTINQVTFKNRFLIIFNENRSRKIQILIHKYSFNVSSTQHE